MTLYQITEHIVNQIKQIRKTEKLKRNEITYFKFFQVNYFKRMDKDYSIFKVNKKFLKISI